MLWIEKIGTTGGQVAVGDNPECSICGELIVDGEVCIGVRKVHDLARHLPFHPSRQFMTEDERVSEFNVNYFTDRKQENEYIHTDCYPYQFVRPFACMFDGQISNASSSEIKNVEESISGWQVKFRKLAAITKKRKSGDDSTEKKTKTSDSTSKRKRRSSSQSSNSTTASSSDSMDFSCLSALDYSAMDSPYLFGLSDDAWYEICSYLPHYSLLNASQTCKAMYFYSSKSLLWESLANYTLCPNAKQVQQEFFPTLADDFKKVFILLYGNCCVICGSYIRKGTELDKRISLYRSKGGISVESHPLYYNFLLDQCQCNSCDSSSIVSTFTRTVAKQQYSVSDEELGCTRCFAKPNPYSPSVSMSIFLKLQVQVLHVRKVEATLRQNYKKSKKHSKEDYLKIIDKGKRGEYGKGCRLYVYLNASDKKICKDNSIYAYIDSLSP